MSPRQSRPPILLRAKPVLRVLEQGAMALSSDPDWDEQFPAVNTAAVIPRSVPELQHPCSKKDFRNLAECGHVLAKQLSWGPLLGIAIRESGQIAAQRFGYTKNSDEHLAEDAFSLLVAAI